MTNYTNAPVLEISNLSKKYGDHQAVAGLSLSVQRGEIFGILGSNGAGKTTSVECAQGIRRADSGRVRVLGRDPVTERAHLRGRVGSQLQDSNLPDQIKVREAIELFADDKSQVKSTMKQWQLESIAKSRFGGLSGGQKQRLFLALALLNQPEVVFLDELTQGLDPNARRDVWELIEKVRDQGSTVVLVTHFMEEAEVLCDRVVVMTGGRAVDEGSPAELIERHSRGVRIRFPYDATDLDWLRSVPEVLSVTCVGSEVEVTGKSPVIAHLGAALVQRGTVPNNIRVDQPNLESALIKIINPNKPDNENGVSQ